MQYTQTKCSEHIIPWPLWFPGAGVRKKKQTCKGFLLRASDNQRGSFIRRKFAPEASYSAALLIVCVYAHRHESLEDDKPGI